MWSFDILLFGYYFWWPLFCSFILDSLIRLVLRLIFDISNGADQTVYFYDFTENRLLMLHFCFVIWIFGSWLLVISLELYDPNLKVYQIFFYLKNVNSYFSGNWDQIQELWKCFKRNVFGNRLSLNSSGVLKKTCSWISPDPLFQAQTIAI